MDAGNKEPKEVTFKSEEKMTFWFIKLTWFVLGFFFGGMITEIILSYPRGKDEN